MIRSMFVDGLVVGGMVAMVYGIWESPDPQSIVVVGAVAFLLGFVGGHRR